MRSLANSLPWTERAADARFPPAGQGHLVRGRTVRPAPSLPGHTYQSGGFLVLVVDDIDQILISTDCLVATWMESGKPII
ncbi:hypothetical protein RW1_066_00160 [Rhodococcus wratislaviensis NBRC 100605]|uniref:Uncharacterized protein n=1 Tax=Rhodococcus wratislaviensis NBRC 100605 TaxID=1219028 RepID=X0PZF4_RHOWR|nr:hypothetical protein RW1_066_00160 [Rhodococcus wratislaviensis NBRC 100605]